MSSVNGSASYHLEMIRRTLSQDSLSLIWLLLNARFPVRY